MTSKWINCLIVTFQDGGIIIPSSRDVFLSAKEDCTKCTYIHSLRFLTCSSNNSQQGRWRLGWTRTNTPCKMSETINVLRSSILRHVLLHFWVLVYVSNRTFFLENEEIAKEWKSMHTFAIANNNYHIIYALNEGCLH